MTRYLLRTCRPNGTSWGNFRWPIKPGAMVEAPDWDPTRRCGGGLHGLLNGEGCGVLLDWSSDAVWLACEIPDDAEVVDLGGKVKVRRCIVRCVGDRETVTAWLAERYPACAIVGGTATAGEGGTAVVGYGGTATAGEGGIINICYWDATASRHRCAIGYVGEDGIEPDVAYRWDSKAGRLVPAEGRNDDDS